MERGKGSRGAKPQRNTGSSSLHATPAIGKDTNTLTPKFCLAYIVNGYCLRELSVEQQAAFALALQKRCEMTWKDITLADRHGLGSEMLPAGQIKPQIPNSFRDRDKFLVIRYNGNLPMVGIRILDVFHVLWIERDYGDVYDHG